MNRQLRARLLLQEARLGLDVDDLVAAATGDAKPVTVAAWIDEIARTFTPSTTATYRPYWRLAARLLGDRHLAELTTADLAGVVDAAAERARSHRPDSTGRASRETCIAALRALYARAVDAGHLTANPAAALRKPLRTTSRRRALDDRELTELADAVRMTSVDPDLDLLLIQFHLETGARRQGALNLRRRDIDTHRAVVWLREKNDTEREQPASPSLIALLVAHTSDRVGSGAGDVVFRNRGGEPITGRRYDRLFARARPCLGWDDRTRCRLTCCATPPSPGSGASLATPSPKPLPVTPHPPSPAATSTPPSPTSPPPWLSSPENPTPSTTPATEAAGSRAPNLGDDHGFGAHAGAGFRLRECASSHQNRASGRCVVRQDLWVAEDEGYVLRLWRTANSVLLDVQGWMTNWELAAALLADESARPLIEERRAEIRSEGREPKSASWMAWNAVSWFSANLWRTDQAEGHGVAALTRRHPASAQSGWPRSYAPVDCTEPPPSKRDTKARNEVAKATVDDTDRVGRLVVVDPAETTAIKDYAEAWARRWLVSDGWKDDQISPPRAVGEDYLCRTKQRMLSVEVVEGHEGPGPRVHHPRVAGAPGRARPRAQRPVRRVRHRHPPRRQRHLVLHRRHRDLPAPVRSRPPLPSGQQAKEYECRFPLEFYLPVED